jgi:hypothetical protein
MVLTHFDIVKLVPLFSSCDFLVGLQKRLLHRLPIGAPNPLIPSCVGWFFESVVGLILDLGCQLKMVVDFEFYSAGCTSYPGCLHVVILFIILRREDWDSIHITCSIERHDR